MRLRLFVSTALFGGLLQTALAQTQARSDDAIPIVTVCEVLNNLSRYNGKSVIVVGRFGSSDEGAWLRGDCERKIVTDGYTWGNIISTTHARAEVKPPPDLPKNFKWDEEALVSKLKQLQTTTAALRGGKQYEGEKWVAMFGRFETRLPLQVAVGGNGIPMGYGFGHLNAAPAQLISNDWGFREITAR